MTDLRKKELKKGLLRIILCIAAGMNLSTWVYDLPVLTIICLFMFVGFVATAAVDWAYPDQ